jgi:hypothetical protein
MYGCNHRINLKCSLKGFPTASVLLKNERKNPINIEIIKRIGVSSL